MPTAVRPPVKQFCLAALVLAMLTALVGPGAVDSRESSLLPTAATGPVVTVQPQSGPPGSSVSLSAVGFDSTLAQKGLAAGISFDSGAAIDTQKLVLCNTVTGVAPTAGFGADCIGTSVMEQVPAVAQPGPQHMFIVQVGGLSASAPFSVTTQDTQTPTVTPTVAVTATATMTITPTDTATSTGTAGPIASATSTETALSTVSSTPTPTATPIPSVIPAVPVVTGPLPVYRLRRTAPPLRFTLAALKQLVPHPTIVTMPDQNGVHLVAGYDGSHLVAYVDLATGDSTLFPELPETGQAPAARGSLQAAAQSILRTSGLIPRDATQARLGAPILAFTASSRQATGSGTNSMAFFPVTRLVEGYPVYGPGSEAVLALTGSGTLRGLVRRWRTAEAAGSINSIRPSSEVLASIQTQLAGIGAGSPVTLDSITLIYYDGNGSYLEPAYRFTATVHVIGAVNADHVIGYEAVATHEPEPLPTWQSGLSVSSPSMGAALWTSDGIGQYVVRGRMPSWNQDAVGFQRGISSFWPRVTGHSHGQSSAGPPVPASAVTTAGAFGTYANSVRILESETPGAAGQFTTDRYCCGLVTVAGLPALGSRSGRKAGLAFWIARAPSLVASPVDTPDPYQDWLPVFDGLHAVVGYRTAIYSNDGVSLPFGADLAMGAPVVSAWLLEVASTSPDRGGKNPLYEAPSAGRVTVPSGRASTLSVCGHVNDSIYDAAPLPRAGCLQAWWLGN